MAGLPRQPEHDFKPQEQRRQGGFQVDLHGESVTSKLKGSRDKKPIDMSGNYGEKRANPMHNEWWDKTSPLEEMPDINVDSTNQYHAVKNQMARRDSYGHRAGGGTVGKGKPPGQPSNPKRPEPKEPEKSQAKKVGEGPDWKGTPPLRAPPPAPKPDHSPPKRMPPSTKHPAPPRIPPLAPDKAPPKRKPIPPQKPLPKMPPLVTATRRTGLSSYGNQVP